MFQSLREFRNSFKNIFTIDLTLGSEECDFDALAALLSSDDEEVHCGDAVDAATSSVTETPGGGAVTPDSSGETSK